MLSGLNTCVLYSRVISSAGSLFSQTIRSYFEVPVFKGAQSTLNPESCQLSLGAFCKINITWKGGFGLPPHPGAIVSKSIPKGSSWCENACNVTSRKRLNNSLNVGQPDKLVRRSTELPKRPINPSTSSSGRFAA